MGFFGNIYYWLFPGELKKKEQRIKEAERKEKGELLLEFEDIAKKKEELKEEIEAQTESMAEFIKIIEDVTSANPFHNGYNKRYARWKMSEFETEKQATYEQLKEKALEYERITFRMFAINQKLKLLNIDHRLRRGEEYEY